MTLNFDRVTLPDGQPYAVARHCTSQAQAIHHAKRSGGKAAGYTYTHIPGRGYVVVVAIDPLTGLPRVAVGRPGERSL